MRLSYRYCCEQCHEESVYVLQDEKVRYGHDYPNGEKGKQLRKKHRKEKFSCHNCGHRSKSVYDKAKDRPVLFTRVELT